MARTFSRNERNYSAGEFGPFSLDSFTRNDTDMIEVRMSVSSWPIASPLFTIRIQWDTGEYIDFVQSWPVTDKFGNLLTECIYRANVPQDAGGKRNVTGGTISGTLFQDIRTAISVAAIDTDAMLATLAKK